MILNCFFTKHLIAILAISGTKKNNRKIWPLKVYSNLKRCDGLKVSALVSESSNLGCSLGRGLCVVFLDKKLYSYNVSLHPGVLMDTGKPNAGGDPAMNKHPIQGWVELLLVAWC